MHKLPTYKPTKCILKCNVHDSENIFATYLVDNYLVYKNQIIRR